MPVSPFFLAYLRKKNAMPHVHKSISLSVKVLLFIAFSLCLRIGSTSAAPLDALLTANTHPAQFNGQVELSVDAVNSTIDIFHLRDSAAADGVGDYQGEHFRGGIGLSRRLWLDGAYWRRTIEYGQDTMAITSWQSGAQVKLIDGDGFGPSLALRLSAWGDTSDSLYKSTPTRVASTTVDTITITDPKDTQYQLDLINTTPVTNQLDFSLFVGGGASTVSVGSLAATYTDSDDCRYDLSFPGNGIFGQLASPCSGPGAILGFSITGPGTNVIQELNYKSTYLQAGTSLQWHNDTWLVEGGYQFQHLSRDSVDEIITDNGGKTYASNHIFIGQVERILFPHASMFVRGQLMTNQLVGEIPFTYNPFTASKFDKLYGFASLGLKAYF